MDVAGSAPIIEKQLTAQKTLNINDLSTKAKQGDYASTLELARRYAEGDGINQNGETALNLYQAVAKTRSDYAIIAQTRIGRLYLEGATPIKQNIIEAYLWFDLVITNHGKDAQVDNERVLRYHNFARLNMTDAERVELQNRQVQSP
ncbi:MAG: hypothetical protein COC09_05115 [Gammaproteobacteria bacterium]|nr:MAG: hypothetical protein COC09_05115 [Gammaproteobacteria bacterium]